MLSYIIRRTLLLFPTLIGITIVVFAFVACQPGGIGANLMSAEGNMRANEREAMEKYLNQRYGLDQPAPVQYLRWLNKVSPIGKKATDEGFPMKWKVGLKWPELGESFIKRRPVSQLVAESLPVTLLLNVLSLPIIYSLSVLTGIKAAEHRGSLFDKASGTTFLALWSMPTILIGTLCIGFLTSDQYLRIFPTSGLHDLYSSGWQFLPHHGAAGWEMGYFVDTLYHLILPVFCLSYGSFAFLSKLSRGAVLDNIASDYARTARAKGMRARDVLYRHVFRNSLLPLITVAAGILPSLLSGAVVVETIFSIRGMGQLGVEAAKQRDVELLLSIVLITGFLGLVGNLLADIGYAMADPRVSYDR